MSDLTEAARFAIDRCRYLASAAPVVYQAKLNPKNTAVFPTELDAHAMRLSEPGDDKDFLAVSPFTLHEAREALRNEGFDSIYLQNRNTLSALESGVIAIVQEYRALPIFNEKTRPQLERDLGDRFPLSYGYLKNLTP